MKKIVIIFALFISTISVNAKVDLKKDYSFYEQACKTKSGYSINVEACDAFLEYQKLEKDSKNKVKYYSDISKLDAEDLASNIREINALLEKKEKQVKETKQLIKTNKSKIKQLEKTTIDLIGSMQYMYDENQVIDVIMESTDLADLMNKVDGLNNISQYNYETLSELDTLIMVTENKQKTLALEIENLEKMKIEQKSMLIEFRRKEAKIYNNMQSGGNTATYNSKVDKIDLNKINDKSKGWKLPLRSGVVSSIPWTYPDGGWHPAVDIATPVGSKILAPANGVIIASGESSGGYGKHIVVAIKKGDYIYTMIFAHLSDFIDITTFKKGEMIAKSGNTGMSTGPHVHIEMFRHNTSNLKAVVSQYKKQDDYWFGIGYNSKGNKDKVARLKTNELFNLKMGQSF